MTNLSINKLICAGKNNNPQLFTKSNPFVFIQRVIVLTMEMTLNSMRKSDENVGFTYVHYFIYIN